MSRDDKQLEDATRTAAPEKVVVEDPPPEPDYPRYRVEPGGRLSLSDIDPDETEHYRKKKDVAKGRRDGYVISTDASRLDLGTVHRFLKTSYWASGVPFEVVERSVKNSMVFGLYRGAKQVGFARVMTDHATFAYLADVFVLETHRGRGLGRWLMETILSHPDLQGLRRWMLATKDAHGLYREFGFAELSNPGIFMEKKNASYGA